MQCALLRNISTRPTIFSTTTRLLGKTPQQHPICETEQSTFRLQDFPDELICLIFGFLDDETCMRVAQISRRYNALVLQEYLSRHRVLHQHNSFGEVPEVYLTSYYAVRALRLSTSITSLYRLEASFTKPATLYDLHQLEGLLSRVHILDKLDFECSFQPKIESSLGKKDLRQMKSLVQSIMYSVTREASEVLVITQSRSLLCKPTQFAKHPLYFTFPYRPSVHTPNNLATILQKPGSFKVKNGIRGSPESRSISLVTIDDKDSQSLVLDADLSAEEWSKVISELRFSQLKRVRIAVGSVPFADWADFFGRHPDLASVVYVGTSSMFQSYPGQNPRPALKFSNLSYLMTTTYDLRYFLHNDTCRQLQTIVLSSIGIGRDPYMEDALSSIARCSHVTKLSIHYLSSKGKQTHQSHSSSRSKEFRKLRNITALNLWDFDLWPGLLDFLERFPSLVRVGLNCLTWRGESSWREGPWPGETKVIRSIADHFPNIRRISVYGFEEDISWWLNRQWNNRDLYHAI